MESLDINTALDIVSRVGETSFHHLAGMLMASKFYHSLATHPIVLRHVCLQPFTTNAASLYRSFFVKCLQANNPTAVYLESIRLSVQIGRAEDGLHL